MTGTRRPACLLLALILAVAACGDDDDDTVATQQRDGSSTQQDGDSSSFCVWMERNATRLLVLDPDDPDLQAFLAEAEAIDPPAEIAEDWDVMISVWTQGPPPSTLDNAQTDERLDRLAEAGDRIEAYLRDECGLDTGG